MDKWRILFFNKNIFKYIQNDNPIFELTTLPLLASKKNYFPINIKAFGFVWIL